VLVATSHRSFAGSVLRTSIFLERQFRAHLISRDHLVFDSRYSPPAKTTSTAVHLYASLRGSFEVHGQPVVTGAHAYALAESELDRVAPSSVTFRSQGAPAMIVELRVPAASLRRPIGLQHGALDLPEPVWRAYAALDAAFSAGTGTEVRLRELLVALGASGVLAADLVASVVTEEPERFIRLWDVMRPLYEDYATSSSLKQIASLANLSLRQLGRDLGDLTRTFGLFGAGFRDAMRVLRLRAAVLLLSAPTATPSDVARAVGYGGLDAMGRAFRDAKLPAPSVLQGLIHYA
jgi:AraC-like DNA-binding protein